MDIGVVILVLGVACVVGGLALSASDRSECETAQMDRTGHVLTFEDVQACESSSSLTTVGWVIGGLGIVTVLLGLALRATAPQSPTPPPPPPGWWLAADGRWYPPGP